MVMTGALMNQAATVVLLLQLPQKPSTTLAVASNRRWNMSTPTEYTKYLDIHYTGN
jgi:hypothetical protein